MKKLAFIAILSLLGIFAVPTTAQASGSPVYVEIHVSSTYWPVKTSAEWVDQYTGTHFVYGSCRTGYKCVKVYEKYIHSYWVAVTEFPYGYNAPIIYLNPNDREYSYSAKLNTVSHEFGHAQGIYYHSKYCSNIMYAYLTCDGHLRSYRFSDYQKSILAKN